MSKLPKRFARHAANLAKSNPIAFSDAASAELSLASSYAQISEANTTGIATGGYYFAKDSDGFIELWVSPDVIWGKADG